MDAPFFLFMSHALFSIGLVGVLVSRNPLIAFLSIEMMLNAGNLLFVCFAKEWADLHGLVWVFFVLVVAAVEAAIGLSLIIHLFRTKQKVDVDQYNSLRG